LKKPIKNAIDKFQQFYNILKKKEGFLNFSASFGAVILGLLVGFIILLISNPSQAVNGFLTILAGGFSGGASGIGQVLYLATPIILTGLSVGFAFKTGLFNIGAPGQFILGAYAAVYIGVRWTAIPSQYLWIVALLGSIIAGALWGLVPGILKALRNVNEVITSIMMNYIGMYLVNYLIVQTVYDSTRNQTLPTATSIPKWGLDKIFSGSGVNGGFFIAILCVVVIYILLNKTTFGYELKACGFNKEASRYAGINAKKSIILSMVIAGALAGLGGGLLYLAGTGTYISVVDTLAAEGFNGIPVALLGLSNPIGIFIAGIFIAYLNQGGFYMQRFDFVPEVIDIIIAVIIYCSAFALVLKNFIEKIRTKKKEGDLQ
jgi:simple sugar transport system permease protein